MGDGPAIWASGSLRPDEWDVTRFASVDSTNRWVLDAARDGAPAGLVAVADHQESGRGRRGRSWDSPPGSSLLVSVLLRPALDPERVHVVTIAAGLALVDAVRRVCGVDAELKWPNDLLVGERKLAGLLAEADIAGGTLHAVVVGAGCNLTQRWFPAPLTDVATSCAIETGVEPDRDAVLEAFLDCLGARLDAPAALLADYRSRLATLGHQVRVDLDGQVVEGRAVDVDDAGRLVLEPAVGRQRVIAAGDVIHLRRA